MHRRHRSISTKSIRRCRLKLSTARKILLAIISTAKLYEVQKYCSLTNHMWDGFWFLANQRAWQNLPDDVRTIVAKHINAAGLKEREDVAKLNASLQQDLTTKGLIFNRPDPAPVRSKLRAAGV